MQFSRSACFVCFLTTVVAQMDLRLAISELPSCAVICTEQMFPPAGCALQDIPSCLCTNTTLQGQLSVCVQTTCNRTEQYATISVSQNLLCKGVPQPSRSTEVIRIVTIISAIAFPLVVLRLCSRYIVARIWWDDWAIVAATASMVPMTAFAIYCATLGFGKHVWDLPPRNIDKILELYYVAQILYVLVQNLAKISILLLFLRVFPGERFRFITKISLAWMACHTTAFFAAVTMQCIPVRTVWDGTRKGMCINAGAVITAGAALSIFEDIAIILLPLRELKNLNLTLRKRLGIMALFALGSFACITSMMRLRYLSSYSVQSLDTSWDGVNVVVWSIIETYTAVICACMMAIRPLLAKYMPSIFQSTRASDTTSWPYSASRSLGTRPPRRINSWYAGPVWNNRESATELERQQHGEICVDGGNSHRNEPSGDEFEQGKGSTCREYMVRHCLGCNSPRMETSGS